MTLMLLGPSKCLKQIIQSELSRGEVVRYRVSGQYLPSLSINYVAINKDLVKLLPQFIR